MTLAFAKVNNFEREKERRIYRALFDVFDKRFIQKIILIYFYQYYQYYINNIVKLYYYLLYINIFVILIY